MRRLDDLRGDGRRQRLRGSRRRSDLSDQRRTVNREHPLAVVHERRERLLLVGGERLIAEDHQRVVVRQPARGERLGRRRYVNQLNAAPGQGRGERPEDRRRRMRRLLAPEEQHAQRPRFRFARGRPLRRDAGRRRSCRGRLRLGQDRVSGGAEKSGENVHRPDLRAGNTGCHGRRTFQVAGPQPGRQRSHGTVSKGRFYYARNGRVKERFAGRPDLEALCQHVTPFPRDRRLPAAAARWPPPTRTRAGTPPATGSPTWPAGPACRGLSKSSRRSRIM